MNYLATRRPICNLPVVLTKEISTRTPSLHLSHRPVAGKVAEVPSWNFEQQIAHRPGRSFLDFGTIVRQHGGRSKPAENRGELSFLPYRAAFFLRRFFHDGGRGAWRIIPCTDVVRPLSWESSCCTTATRTTAPACDATAGRAVVLNRPGCVKVRDSWVSRALGSILTLRAERDLSRTRDRSYFGIAARRRRKSNLPARWILHWWEKYARCVCNRAEGNN